MAAPLMSNASRASAGTSPEGPPVLGRSRPLGIVSRITSLLGEVVSPVVAAPVVLVPVVSSVLPPGVSPVVVPVVVPVVPVVLLVVVPVVPVVLPVVVPVVLPVVVPVVPVVVSTRRPGVLSSFLLVLSSRCMVLTISKPPPQLMKSTPLVSRAKIRSSPLPANTLSSP
jgi:hypothetical protein